ncbi:hypothetical protein B0H19DRAFT_1123358, partial [Mycena capillaripes]
NADILQRPAPSVHAVKSCERHTHPFHEVGAPRLGGRVAPSASAGARARRMRSRPSFRCAPTQLMSIDTCFSIRQPSHRRMPPSPGERLATPHCARNSPRTRRPPRGLVPRMRRTQLHLTAMTRAPMRVGKVRTDPRRHRIDDDADLDTTPLRCPSQARHPQPHL